LVSRQFNGNEAFRFFKLYQIAEYIFTNKYLGGFCFNLLCSSGIAKKLFKLAFKRNELK